ncbi:MAG TPA: hypothetical protein VHR45_01165 [Thermoanaerobaculia bacterium]|nr:hypothetical protein [Thermoanaerobaculia bacterium]
MRDSAIAVRYAGGRGRARLGACLLAGSFAAALVYADISLPTVTRVYFERGGRPVRGAVDFTVRCFGYQTWPTDPRPAKGSYKPKEVFSFSAKCPDYGCEIHEPFYLNHRHIDWCDLEGRSGERPFKIERYGASPIDFTKCSPLNAAEPRRCEMRVKIPQ